MTTVASHRDVATTTALAALFVGTAAIAVAFGSAWLPGGAPMWGVWCMIVGSALSMSGMVGIGALRSRVRRRSIAVAVIVLLAVIIAGFGAALVLPAETVNGPFLLGLPRRAAIEIFGVGLLPLVVLPGLFALEFRSDGLDERSLAAFRAHCARLRGE
ncbi:MAG TPA: hypothetical protein VGL65_10380 [Gemmatimonadales bacterium]